MTIREAILSEVTIPGVPLGKVNKAAIDLLVDPNAEYNPELHKTLVNTASLSVLYSLRGITSISEGGFSISLNPAAIEQRINDLLGGSSLKPTISDASHFW